MTEQKMGKALTWGLKGAIPDGAVAAWGARALLSRDPDGGFQVLHDRQNLTARSDALRAAMGRLVVAELGDAMEKCRTLRREGTMRGDRQQQHVLHEYLTLSIVGDTQASSGYLYLAAWLTDGDTQAAEQAVSYGDERYDPNDYQQIKWSATGPPPALGDAVAVKQGRRVGQGTVVGYLLEHGWVYLLVVPMGRAQMTVVAGVDL